MKKSKFPGSGKHNSDYNSLGTEIIEGHNSDESSSASCWVPPVVLFVVLCSIPSGLSVLVLSSSTGGLKAARAASTVLLNMFQYNKLHKDYKLVSDDRTLLNTLWVPV